MHKLNRRDRVCAYSMNMLVCALFYVKNRQYQLALVKLGQIRALNRKMLWVFVVKLWFNLKLSSLQL